MCSFDIEVHNGWYYLRKKSREDGTFKSSEDVLLHLKRTVMERINACSAMTPGHVRDLEYARFQALLRHIRSCNEPSDYKWFYGGDGDFLFA